MNRNELYSQYPVFAGVHEKFDLSVSILREGIAISLNAVNYYMAELVYRFVTHQYAF